MLSLSQSGVRLLFFSMSRKASLSKHLKGLVHAFLLGKGQIGGLFSRKASKLFHSAEELSQWPRPCFSLNISVDLSLCFG